MALVAFSQLGSIFDGDEGMHLVALLLVQHGQQPFVDFYYWHQPLYLYIASAWAAIAGEGWRSARLLSALLTAAATAVIAVLASALHVRNDRVAWGAVAAIFFALNGLVLRWGTMAHNYAPALLFTVLAMAAAIRSVSATDRRAAFGAGLFAGAATATTLLTAPLLAVLLVWMAANNVAGSGRRKLMAAIVAAPVAFLPVALIAWRAPWRTFFGVVVHNTYERVDAADTAAYHRELAGIAIRSPQFWLLIGLSACALAWYRRRSPAKPLLRVVTLSTWLLGTFTVCIVILRSPLHAVYLVVLAPSLALLAAAGAAALIDAIGARGRAGLVAAGIASVFIASQAVSAYRSGALVNEWSRIERFAAEVLGVTPRGATVYSSFSFVYFAARRLPPDGFENPWASEMPFPTQTFEAVSLVPAADITRRIQEGEFDTVLIAHGDPRFDEAALDRRYAHRAELDRYFVLRWGRLR